MAVLSIDQDGFKTKIGIKKRMLLYPNFQKPTSSSSRKNVSLKKKSSLPIKLQVPISKSACKKITEFDVDEDGDFDKQFGEEACKWLSSGTTSLSFENRTFSILLDPSLDEWLYFLLSLVENPSLLLNNYIACFDGSQVNPIEEAYLVMRKTILGSDTSHLLQQSIIKRDEEEVVAWLSSTRSDQTEPIVWCSSNENYTQKFNELPDMNMDSDRRHFFLSLVNLEEEICWWNSDTESEIDSSWYGSDEFFSSSSSVSSVSNIFFDKSLESSMFSDCVSWDLNLEDFEFDEPLVWPSDRTWNWGNLESEGHNFFVMSPCRPELERGNTRVTMDIKRGGGQCKKPSRFPPKSKNSQMIDIHEIKEIRKAKGTLSKVLDLKYRRNSLKALPLDDTVDCMVESRVEKVVETLKDEEFLLSGEDAIEMFLGLEEFDGREGIGKGIWKDVDFCFEELLR